MWLWFACAAPEVAEIAVEEPTIETSAPSPVWPAAGTPLRPFEVVIPEDFGRRRILVDPGHGAPNNGGNTSCRGAREQDVALAQGRALAERLAAVPAFEVTLSRDGAVVPYGDRLTHAARWGADAVVSLHTDARAGVRAWQEGGHWCTDGAEGLAVLYSDEGDGVLVEARARLARALGRRIAEAGLMPYPGVDYQGLYAPDDEVLGVFLDRHAPRQRIMMLRKSRVPLVIVETHNALDPDEPARWDEAATLDAFASAVAAALVDALAAR